MIDVIPPLVQMYLDINSGSEPLERLALVLTDDVTAEFRGMRRGDTVQCTGREEVGAVIRKRREGLPDMSISPRLKVSAKDDFVEVSFVAVADVAPPGDPAATRRLVYDVDAQYHLRKRVIFHIAEYWTSRPVGKELEQ